VTSTPTIGQTLQYKLSALDVTTIGDGAVEGDVAALIVTKVDEAKFAGGTYNTIDSTGVHHKIAGPSGVSGAVLAHGSTAPIVVADVGEGTGPGQWQVVLHPPVPVAVGA